MSGGPNTHQTAVNTTCTSFVRVLLGRSGFVSGNGKAWYRTPILDAEAGPDHGKYGEKHRQSTFTGSLPHS